MQSSNWDSDARGGVSAGCQGHDLGFSTANGAVKPPPRQTGMPGAVFESFVVGMRSFVTKVYIYIYRYLMAMDQKLGIIVCEILG